MRFPGPPSLSKGIPYEAPHPAFEVVADADRRVALAYLAAIAVAELVTTFADARAGVVLHSLLLIAMLGQASLALPGARHRFLVSLTLAPTIRVLSLGMPVGSTDLIYWYAMIGVPVLLAAVIVIRTTALSAAEIGLRFDAHVVQWSMGLAGVGLGFTEYVILRPAPLIDSFSVLAFAPAAVLIGLSTGFVEELVFRGVLQTTSTALLGRSGVVYVAALFAALHIGYASITDVVFVFAVGLLFGLLVRRTGSIWGVTLAHALTNATLFLVAPFVLHFSLHLP